MRGAKRRAPNGVAGLLRPPVHGTLAGTPGLADPRQGPRQPAAWAMPAGLATVGPKRTNANSRGQTQLHACQHGSMQAIQDSICPVLPR